MTRLIRLTLMFTSLCVLAIVHSNAVYAQNPRKFGKCPTEDGMYKRFPFERESKSLVVFHKLTDLARVIRDQIELQLKERVGTGAYRRIKLDEGIARDFDESTELVANNNSRVDGYDLTFKFVDKARGLRGYIFSVAANRDGKFISNIEFPDSALDPRKILLIPCYQALLIAEQNGFPKERSSIYITYDSLSQSLAWEIVDNKAVEPDESLFGFRGQGTFRHILVNANSGKVIKIYKETIAL